MLYHATRIATTVALGSKAVVPWRLSWIGRLIAWYGYYENTAFALMEENASAVQYALRFDHAVSPNDTERRLTAHMP